MRTGLASVLVVAVISSSAVPAGATSAGAGATAYVINAVADLYTQSSLFGCTLASDNVSCAVNPSVPSLAPLDDFTRTEIENGEAIGSDAGIAALCSGTVAVDFARTTRPPTGGDNCPGAVALQYAWHSVVGLVFPFHNVGAVMCSPGDTCASQIGPVAAGWRPGDQPGGPYSGNAFSDLSNSASAALGGASLAQEIYCDKTGAHAINDWGQLSDPTPDGSTGVAKGLEGIGAPIGVPIVIPFVNPATGTYATWKTFVGCDPNTKNADGRVMEENDASELSSIATADHPTDSVAASNQVAATIYFVSYGASQCRRYVTRVAATDSGFETTIDGVQATPAAELGGPAGIATARGLYVAYLRGSLSTGGADFLSWLCDSDPSSLDHGTDVTTGRNYAAEVTNTVTTQFVFPRVSC